jgi:DNA-directed RNA polymerase specialized sigma24 family protein
MTIESLQPRIRTVACRLAQDYQVESCEEWQQIMSLAILERDATDKRFLRQRSAYIISYAAWRARDWYRATFAARKLGLDNAPYSLDAEAPNGMTLAEAIAGDEPDLELAVDVKTAIGTLTGRARQVAELLLAGLQRAEIAKAFGIRSQSLAGDLARVRVALAPIYAS